MKLHTMLPAIAFAAGQEAGAADQAMPPMGGMQGGMDMSKAGQASFDKMDADKDGKVSQEEFLKAHPGMKPEAFARIDKNGDKVITSEEWGFQHGRRPRRLSHGRYGHAAGRHAPIRQHASFR